MVENGSKLQRCRFCNSSFSVEILSKIEKDKEDVYCENCGDLLYGVNNKYNFYPPVISENESKLKTNIKERPVKPRKKLKPNPDALHYPIGRVFYDTDFPLTFKSNFIIVFSRLICYSALRLDQAGEIDLCESEPSENVINDLYMATRVIQNKRVKPEFLNNLRESSTEEFEGNLAKIQNKIQTSRQYLEDFHVYSRWLIKRVFFIITGNKPDDQLTKFEKTILHDLQLLTIDDLKLPAKFEKSTNEKNGELEETREDSEFDMTLGPQKTSITYEDYLALIEMREDITVGMNRVEFYKTLIKCGNTTPSEIKLKWCCSKKKHAWKASYHSIRNGDGCPRCPKGSKVDTHMTKEEFDNAIEEKDSNRPSSVKLIWKCVKFDHTRNRSNDFVNTLAPPSDPTLSNVNEWFTNTLLETMKQYNFLKKYASLRKMSPFFGLTKSYLYDKRYKKSVISHDYLDKMGESVTENINNLLNLNTSSEGMIMEARNRLLLIIETYRRSYDPKLTANTQIDKNLNTTYFQDITTLQQAYYLGLLFADGWISVPHSSGGSTSYRIGLSLKVEDKPVIERFSEAIGLKKERVLERDSTDLRTGVVYRMAYLQFGVGSTSLKNSMANDLINLGMTYQITKKGKRAKVPILPVFCDEEGNMLRELMFSFLLGYFDGDGTLKNSFTGWIYSNNYKFLNAIKTVYNLGKVSRAKRKVYDPNTNTYSERSLFSLYLDKRIIKEMMSLNLVSMERKRLDPKKIKFDDPIMTKQRKWLKKVLPITFLKQILETHSPSKIAELIGVDHNTLLKFVRNVCKLTPKEKGYYIRLSYERKKSSVKNKLNIIYNERTQHLTKIGELNPFK